MRLLITGGAGFIGAHLAHRALQEGFDVSVLDNLSRGARAHVPAGAKLYVEDIRSPGLQARICAIAPQAIVHLAAQMNIRSSMLDPVHDTEVNVMGTVRLLQAAQCCGVQTLIAASTGGAIYGEAAPLPTPESQRCAPNSPYGISKLCSEVYLDYFGRTTPMRCITLRLANVFGPRQNSGGGGGVVGIFARAMLAGTPPCIFGNGQQTRDYIFVDDVVEAILCAIAHPTAQGIYNVGTGLETSLLTLVEELRWATGYSGGIVFCEARPGEQQRSCLSYARAREQMGFAPKTHLRLGLDKTVSWCRQAPVARPQIFSRVQTSPEDSFRTQ